MLLRKEQAEAWSWESLPGSHCLGATAWESPPGSHRLGVTAGALPPGIGKQAAASDMSEEQITALATICMAVMDGLQIQWLLDPETDMAANFEVFGEIVQRAIASPSAPSVAGADGDAADR